MGCYKPFDKSKFEHGSNGYNTDIIARNYERRMKEHPDLGDFLHDMALSLSETAKGIEKNPSFA